MALSLGFAVRSRMASRRARRLERDQRALVEDIDAMQAALVPEVPRCVGALHISAAYRPADGPAAGGDFYDAFEIDGGRVVILLGDVSGHGRAALAHAARMRYTVRAYAEAGLSPRQALQLTSSAIGVRDDGLYTTLVLARYDATTASLTYASAGHPPPLFLGSAAHEPLISGASPPVGWGIPSGRRQTTVPFPAGTCVCFFSDGLVEAPSDGDLLGRDRLSALFAQLDSKLSAAVLLAEVVGCASELRDDMAACIVKATSGVRTPGSESWLEELELDLDQLNLGHGHRFLSACGLGMEEIGRALSLTRAVVAGHGTAVLAVTLPARSWTVTAPSEGVRHLVTI